ncbi:MAG: hypothetical protein ABIT58_01595 [Ferruginibacter sp.]
MISIINLAESMNCEKKVAGWFRILASLYIFLSEGFLKIKLIMARTPFISMLVKCIIADA